MHTSTVPPAPPLPAKSLRKARFWNRAARRYARAPIADLPGYERTIERVRGLLLPVHEVLELGCGTGSTALRLAPGVRRLVATDVSPDMVAIAREKLISQSVPQLEFRLADADLSAGPPDGYDAVLAFNLLHLVDDLDHALHNAVKTLKPGGRLITKTPCLLEMNPLIPKLALPLMRAVGLAPAVLCLDAALLTSAMRRQGLRIESVERHGSRTRDYRPFIVAQKTEDALPD
ncbi:MAG: class I SAM-dependent methyltransferase [Hydrogenophaga sp.]|nr:class I SAM-dependent methyltransferase [Hydrogenophaga sp.]